MPCCQDSVENDREACLCYFGLWIRAGLRSAGNNGIAIYNDKGVLE